MSKAINWTLRIVLFLVVTFLFLISGIFNNLAESLRIPVANFLNHFNFGDPVLYAESYSDHLEHSWLYVYVVLNVVAGAGTMIVLTLLAKLSRHS